MAWLTDVGLFALLFFVLVFVHELGHFLMARWVGIRVERFAIGMGPAVLSFKKGFTEYRLALLPLGGYVKMAGDDPSKEYSEEEKRVGFLTQSPPKKLLVVFGGPGFNLILPIILFSLLLAAGVPTMQPIVGSLEKGMPAEKSGLLIGDKILSINSHPISKWSEFESGVETSANKDLALEVERLNVDTGERDLVTVHITPKLTASKTKFGEDTEIGKVGISPDYAVPQIFFTDTNSVLAKAQFQRFDRVMAINGTSVPTNDQFQRIVSRLKAGTVEFTIDRNGKIFQKSFEIPEGRAPVVARLGLKPDTLVLGHIEKASPAEKAGLQEGDLLLSIGGKPLTEWEDVAKIVRGSEGKPTEIVWNRNEEAMKAMISPEKTVLHDPLMGKDNPLAREAAYRIGISPATRSEPSIFIERSLNPIECLKRGVTESWKMTTTTIIGLYKLFTGKLSLKLLGSPIMIYKVASNSYRMAGGGYFGWFSFVSNLAVLSITLGLVNLLPVPILDGGHAVFFFVEWIRGRPVSLRVMEIASQVGLFLLICLFALVLYNDFFRYGWIDSILKLFH